MVNRETTKLLMNYMIEPIARLCESFIIDRSPDPGRMFAAGHWELARDLLNQDNKDECLYGACESGERVMIDLALTKRPANYQYAVEGVSSSKNLDAARYIVELGRHEPCLITNTALIGAATSGDVEMCKFIVAKMYELFSRCFVPNYLCAASGPQWKEIVDMACSYGAFDPNVGLLYAAMDNSQERIDYFIANGAIISHGIKGAFLGGHLELLDRLMKLSPYDQSYNIECLESGSIEIFQFIITKGYIPSKISAQLACCRDHYELYDYILATYGFKCELCSDANHAQERHNSREYKRHRNDPGDFLYIPTLL